MSKAGTRTLGHAGAGVHRVFISERWRLWCMRASWARATCLVALLVVLLLACHAPATTPAESARAAGSAGGSTASAAPGPAGWDQLVDAAKQEGKVVVYAPPGTEYRRVIIDAFERAYPGIRVEATFADINEQFSRLNSERT